MKIKPIIAFIVFLDCVFPIFAKGNAFDPNRLLLPHDYAVYVNGTTVINHPEINFSLKMMPTDNEFRDYPGCYVACYSHDEKTSVYKIDNKIYVMGQIRVPGRYINRICRPNNYEHKDISTESHFKTLCKEKIKTCHNIECWAGGDTGGWFGIQPPILKN